MGRTELDNCRYVIARYEEITRKKSNKVHNTKEVFTSPILMKGPSRVFHEVKKTHGMSATERFMASHASDMGLSEQDSSPLSPSNFHTPTMSLSPEESASMSSQKPRQTRLPVR